MKLARRSSSPIRARLACALGLAAALLLAAPRPARAQPQSPITAAQADLARDLFRKAAKEYKAGKVNEAYRDYLAAWNIQQSPDTAGNLGAVELELGYFREAAEHASYAIAHFPPTGSKDQRAALVSVIAEAKKQIGVLTIQVNVAGATLSIDGKPIGRAPLDGEVYIEPGDHTLLAEAPDYEPAQQNVHVDKGSSTPVALSLLPRAPTGPGATTTPTNWPRPLAIAGVATAGAGYAVGIALAIMTEIKATDASSQQRTITGGKNNTSACPAMPAPSSPCGILRSDEQSRGAFASTSLWMFVGATVVAAGTLVYTFAVPRVSAPSATTGMSVVPVVTPSGGAVVIQGSF
jgi:hypothetical protein